MKDDTIKRSDAIKAVLQKPAIHGSDGSWYHADDIKDALESVPSADSPQLDKDLVEPIGNGNVIMSEDTYEELLADRPQEWIPCSERLPETDNTNEINEFDALLVVRPKKHPERTPQVYIGKLCSVEGDDGSGNFWGIKTAPCERTIWGWSYFQEPEVLAWMPLPKPWKGAGNE